MTVRLKNIGAAIAVTFALTVGIAGGFCDAPQHISFVARTVEAASPEVTDERAESAYWTEQNPDGERVLFTSDDIAAFNAAMRAETETLKDFANESVTPDVRDGGATRRGNLRTVPEPPDGSHYDEQQATAVDPCEALLVYEDSDDGKFSHVVMRNYEGWLSKREFGLTDRATWMQFAAPKDFAVVTANQWWLHDDAMNQDVLCQMGAKIPIVYARSGDRPEAAGNMRRIGTTQLVERGAHRQNVREQYLEQRKRVAMLLVPSRAKGGALAVHEQPAVFDDDLHHGFLPCTENNFVRQGFRFFGDIYGWGGLDDSVDCSAFTSDVYRSMGLEIPRDADVQGEVLPYRIRLHGRAATRLALLKAAFPIGTLLTNDTHVMMYIGCDADGTPMALQAMSSYFDDDGKHYLRRVVLTTLTYPNAKGKPYIDGVKYLSAIR